MLVYTVWYGGDPCGIREEKDEVEKVRSLPTPYKNSFVPRDEGGGGDWE